MKGIIGLSGQTRNYTIGATISVIGLGLLVTSIFSDARLHTTNYIYFLGITSVFSGLIWNFNKVKCPNCGSKWLMEMNKYRLEGKRSFIVYKITACPSCGKDYGKTT